jgi:hypothetical protein
MFWTRQRFVPRSSVWAILWTRCRWLFPTISQKIITCTLRGGTPLQETPATLSLDWLMDSIWPVSAPFYHFRRSGYTHPITSPGCLLPGATISPWCSCPHHGLAVCKRTFLLVCEKQLFAHQPPPNYDSSTTPTCCCYRQSGNIYLQSLFIR